jgi:hypothetical protein
MTPAKGDVALLEKLLAESGRTRLGVTGGASALLLSSADETGAQRERFRLVAIPNHKYRVEIAEGGRWRNAGISGLLEAVVAALLNSPAGRALS